jgi:hypothetical protein
MHALKNEVKHVEFVEDDLIRKENKLEEKVKHDKESWGEQGDDHLIDMKPLMPHVSEHGGAIRIKEMLSKVKDHLGKLRE